MSAEGNVLIGALLDRLGKTEAQALLARLDRWLSQDGDRGHVTKKGIDQDQVDQDQIPSIDAPYDRRRHRGNEVHREQSKAAS